MSAFTEDVASPRTPTTLETHTSPTTSLPSSLASTAPFLPQMLFSNVLKMHTTATTIRTSTSPSISTSSATELVLQVKVARDTGSVFSTSLSRATQTPHLTSTSQTLLLQSPMVTLLASTPTLQQSLPRRTPRELLSRVMRCRRAVTSIQREEDKNLRKASSLAISLAPRTRFLFSSFLSFAPKKLYSQPRFSDIFFSSNTPS